MKGKPGMKRIENLVAFPVDAESSPFFGALATVLLPALGYAEDTPFYCAPKGSFCVRCGGCGDKTALQRHHLQLYHDFVTRTGASLLWSEPETDDALVERVMDIAGLSWERFSPDDSRDAVLRALKKAVDAGFPALLKLGDGGDWRVVAGYDEAGRLYGLDARARADTNGEDGWFVFADCFSRFRSAIVVTGRGPSRVSLADSLARMIEALERADTDALEKEVLHKIDAATPENAYETALWLNGVAGYPIEARWHAAECAGATLMRMTENQAARDRLFAVVRQYVFDGELDATHGTYWKIWGLLGVGPETGYAVLPDRTAGIAEPTAKAELRRLFAIVFQNDRVVLGFLREANEILGEVTPE
jgi:hypothetical protein